MEHGIRRYFGTFTGLSPTDESKIAMGEIQVTINTEGIEIRHATGLTVLREFVSLEQVRALTEAEVQKQFNDGSSHPKRVDGFQIGEGVVLLFLRNPAKGRGFWFWRKPAEYRLVIRRGDFIEMLGPTVLYDEAQIADGNFEQIIKAATKSVGQYPFPRLQYEGLHEPRSN
jgi:hypothetical protein